MRDRAKKRLVGMMLVAIAVVALLMCYIYYSVQPSGILPYRIVSTDCQGVNAIQFSSDGRLLVIGGHATVPAEDGQLCHCGRIIVLSASSFTELWSSSWTRFCTSTSAFLSPTDEFLISSGGGIYISDFKEKRALGYFGPGEKCVMSTDGKSLIATNDTEVYLYRFLNKHSSITFPGHTSQVTALATSGKKVWSGDERGNLKIWNAETGEEFFSAFAHERGVMSLAVSERKGTFLSGGYDGVLITWDLAKLCQLRKTSFGSPVLWTGYSPSEELVAVALFDRIIVIEQKSGQVVAKLRGYPFGGSMRIAAFSPDSRQLAAGGRSGTIAIWSIGDIRPSGQ